MAFDTDRVAVPGGGTARAGSPLRRGLRQAAFTCFLAQPGLSRFAGRLLVVVATLLTIDCYLLRAWVEQPALPRSAILIATTLSDATRTEGLMQAAGTAFAPLPASPWAEDATAETVDPDALIRGLALGLGLVGAIAAGLAFLADGVLRLGALAHRVGVRRAVRRLSRGMWVG